MLTTQEQKNIDIVRDLILNRVIRKANTEDNILKATYKLTELSRSEVKKLLDCYVDQYWMVQRGDDGVNMYTLKPFSNLGGL